MNILLVVQNEINKKKKIKKKNTLSLLRQFKCHAMQCSAGRPGAAGGVRLRHENYMLHVLHIVYSLATSNKSALAQLG